MVQNKNNSIKKKSAGNLMQGFSRHNLVGMPRNFSAGGGELGVKQILGTRAGSCVSV